MNFGIILGSVGLILIIIGFVLCITNDTREIRKQNKAPEKTREPEDKNEVEFQKRICGNNYSVSINYFEKAIHYRFGYSPELYFRLKHTGSFKKLSDYCKDREISFCNEEMYDDKSNPFLLSTHIHVPYYDLSEFENSMEFQSFLLFLRESDKLCCSSESPEAQVAVVNDHCKRIEDILSD